MARKPAKLTKPIIRFGYQYFVFDSLNQAADAIKFFTKLRPVKFDSCNGEHFYRPSDDDDDFRIELEARWEYRENPKQLSLPAPKRGTVPCLVCESVSVRPGHACDSCGTIAPAP